VLTYDAENRLVAVDGLIITTLANDGQGNRVLRQMAGETRLCREDWFDSDTGYTAWVRNCQSASADSA
jgi:hypothetical protein